MSLPSNLNPLIANTISCLKLLKRRADETNDCTFVRMKDGSAFPTRAILESLIGEWEKEKPPVENRGPSTNGGI